MIVSMFPFSLVNSDDSLLPTIMYGHIGSRASTKTLSNFIIVETSIFTYHNI